MKKRMTMLILTTILSLQFAAMPLAIAAEETALQNTRTNGDGTLTVTQTYLETDEAPVLPETVVQDGKRYTLDKTTTAPDPNYERPRQSFARMTSSQIPIEGIGNLGAYFPATLYIEEGDFKGDIPLNAVSPYSVVERYEAFSHQVDRIMSYPNLPDNDVSRLPAQQDFEVSSADSLGATQWRTLTYTDVQYAVTGTDSLGLPNSYTATVTYRGQEEYLELVFYEVAANYAGELESSENQMVVMGTYRPPAPAPATSAVPVTPTTTATDPVTPLAEPEFPVFPLAIAGTTIVVFLAIPLLFFFFLTNAHLIRITERDDEITEGKPNSKKKEETALICRRRLVLKDGMAEFRIPSNVDIMDGGLYYLAIKPRMASRNGSVELTWQGKTMAVLPLQRHTDINFREMLVASVEAVLVETDLLD